MLRTAAARLSSQHHLLPPTCIHRRLLLQSHFPSARQASHTSSSSSPHHDAQPTEPPAASPTLPKNPINNDIPYTHVTLILPSGKLSPAGPQPLSTLLSTLDRKASFIQLVSTHPTPLVKVLSKSESYARKKVAQAKARVVQRRNVIKEIQVTWGVARGDMEHKLDKAREELGGGVRVDIVFARKEGSKGKGAPVPTRKEMEDKAEDVLEKLKDVGMQWAPFSMVRGVLVIHLKPVSVVGDANNNNNASGGGVDEDVDKAVTRRAAEAERRERDRARTKKHNPEMDIPRKDRNKTDVEH